MKWIKKDGLEFTFTKLDRIGSKEYKVSFKVSSPIQVLITSDLNGNDLTADTGLVELKLPEITEVVISISSARNGYKRLTGFRTISVNAEHLPLCFVGQLSTLIGRGNLNDEDIIVKAIGLYYGTKSGYIYPPLNKQRSFNGRVVSYYFDLEKEGRLISV